MPDLSIELIRVEKRFRKTLGDLTSLMKSIREMGLLHPVVVNSENVLIAGARRLEACKRLGMAKVPVRVINLEDLLRAEHDENVERLDFLPSESVTIKRALEPIEKERANQRLREAGRLGGQTAGRGREKQGSAKLAEGCCGETRDKVALATGMGRTSLQKAEEVVKAAETEPDRYGDLVEEMDRTGRINGVYRKLRTLREIERIEEEPLPLPTGPFRVIVVDPPWHYRKREVDITTSGVVPYPSMSLDEIRALPVSDIAADDSVLWLWTTNAHLPDSFDIVKAWGFEYKTLLTWCKNKMGMGDWLRGRTEHCLMAVRGHPVVNLTSQTTAIHGAVRGHSRKPDEFYELVESLCPGAKVELFAREPRQGWTSWGTVNRGFPEERRAAIIND